MYSKLTCPANSPLGFFMDEHWEWGGLYVMLKEVEVQLA